MSFQKSKLRNFIDCKIIMFKLQKHGFSNPFSRPFLGCNLIFLEFSIKMCLLLSLYDLIISMRSELNTYQKMKIKKKLDFYTSIRSISRSGDVMKRKTELLTNFIWKVKTVDPNDGNVAERNPKSMQFFFLCMQL
jgi:hypothetical protein